MKNSAWIILAFLFAQPILCVIPAADEQNTLKLHVSLRFNTELYRGTSYSEPPQMAIWIEEKNGKKRPQTLWVTSRMAENRWEGKLYCPLALPIWEAIFKSRWPIIRGRRQLPDGVSSATPQEVLNLTRILPNDGDWLLRIELNLSGDYNSHYPFRRADGSPDMEGNGQPSIIYEGVLSDAPARVEMVVIGRSEPGMTDGRINPDMTGIDTARHIIKELNVEVL